MKSLILTSFLIVFSSTTYAYTINCKQDDTVVQIIYKSDYEHSVQLLQGDRLVGSQGQVFCGSRIALDRRRARVEGGECNSHLSVGGDDRYRQPADFKIKFQYVTGSEPKQGRGKAVADIKMTFRNKKTRRTETIELKDVSCLVSND